MTQLQNYWAGKRPLEVIWSNSLISLNPVAQDYVWMASECLQGWRLHNLSAQHVAMLGHFQSIKKCFLTFRRNLLCFSSCSLPLVQSLGTSEKPVSLDHNPSVKRAIPWHLCEPCPPTLSPHQVLLLLCREEPSKKCCINETNMSIG